MKLRALACGLVLVPALLSGAVRADEDAPARASLKVALLPLFAGEGMTLEEARGATALLRNATGSSGLVELRKARSDDERTVRGCRRRGELDVACLGDAAFDRGVDLLAAGTVHGTRDGFRYELVIVEPRGKAALRTVEEMARDGALERGLERTLRRAFAPEALAGTLMVTGRPDGALILVDGERLGKLPLEAPLGPFVEGEHALAVRARGYEPLKRPVDIVYDEVTEEQAVLSRSREGQLDDIAERRDVERASAPLPIGPAGLGGIGAALIVSGAVAGTFAMLDGLEVEARAAAQQLVFPRDELLFRRGQILAASATLLYIAGTLTGAGAAAWWAAPILFPPEDAYALEEERPAATSTPPATKEDDAEEDET